MLILLGTYQGFDEIRENMDQRTALVYWDRTDIQISFPDIFGLVTVFACSGSIFVTRQDHDQHVR